MGNRRRRGNIPPGKSKKDRQMRRLKENQERLHDLRGIQSSLAIQTRELAQWKGREQKTMQLSPAHVTAHQKATLENPKLRLADYAKIKNMNAEEYRAHLLKFIREKIRQAQERIKTLEELQNMEE